MDYKRLKKLLDQIVVVGKTKKTFWRKSKSFELRVYYTPVKNKILIMDIEGCDLDHPKLFIDFKLGDDLSTFLNWIDKNGHQITFQRNRLGN